MAVYELSLKDLDKVQDGRVTTAWQQALKRAIADCEDRPGNTEARKVILIADLVPRLDEDGEYDTVRVQFHIKDSTPVRKTKKFDMQPRVKDGSRQLVFNDLSDENAAQRTLDESNPADWQND